MPTAPYLSVVATARNDDHGGNLLRRAQTFVNLFLAQVKRYQIAAELILIDWNPPPDKPPLAAALRWPVDAGACHVRVIAVPAAVHKRYRYSDSLPLYQMIAKNAGIRRAQGEYILATNIDILLANELAEFLAGRRLEQGRMYRVDRHDVGAEVPVDACPDDQLVWCDTHRIRVNAREGTFGLTPKGLRSLNPLDIAAPDSGIWFGPGWYAPEQHFAQAFRWVRNESEIALRPSAAPRILLLEIEPGPEAGSGELSFEIAGIGEARLSRRSLVRILIPPNTAMLRFSVTSSRRHRSASGHRSLDFRVLRCEWEHPPAAGAAGVTVRESRARRIARAWQIGSQSARIAYRWARGEKPKRIGIPASRGIRDRLRLRAETNGISLMIGAREATHGDFEATPADLHTNACGDFTLLHRNHWHELRGYPEFDLYSMNLDSLFCYMAHYAGASEQVLGEPMRIYHIEHGAGSGWTPEGEQALFARLAGKGIPWLEFEQVLSWAKGMERFRTPMVFNREDWGLAEFSLPETHPLGS